MMFEGKKTINKLTDKTRTMELYVLFVFVLVFRYHLNKSGTILYFRV